MKASQLLAYGNIKKSGDIVRFSLEKPKESLDLTYSSVYLWSKPDAARRRRPAGAGECISACVDSFQLLHSLPITVYDFPAGFTRVSRRLRAVSKFRWTGPFFFLLA